MEVVRHGLSCDALGPVDYHETWRFQRDLHARVVKGEHPGAVLLLEHHSVYTAGKRTDPLHMPLDGTSVVTVDRGGSITWHGPGQLIAYPILRLPQRVYVGDLVRRLERCVMAVCTQFAVPTVPVTGRSGVWVPADERGPERKICAIGLRVTQGVSMHGIALNCDADLSAFDRITPCGISDAGVTSLSQELDRTVTVAEVAPVFEAQVQEFFADFERVG
ncbi:MAG: lipoyl(octanoyl) transferase LipB [Actinobacteria bacterium]|nr:lipoyl(octanoyl) transferase LipB [Actinomycetota bacterium]